MEVHNLDSFWKFGFSLLGLVGWGTYLLFTFLQQEKNRTISVREHNESLLQNHGYPTLIMLSAPLKAYTLYMDIHYCSMLKDLHQRYLLWMYMNGIISPILKAITEPLI